MSGYHIQILYDYIKIVLSRKFNSIITLSRVIECTMYCPVFVHFSEGIEHSSVIRKEKALVVCSLRRPKHQSKIQSAIKHVKNKEKQFFFLTSADFLL